MVPSSERRSLIQVPPLVSLLLDLNAAASTGVLEVQAVEVVTLIYVLEGVPVFAEEGTLGETLGRVLVRDLQLTEGEYRKVLEHMTSSPMKSEQLRFGEVAVLLGFLTEDEVDAALAAQVTAKVARCLQSPDAECTFRDGKDAVLDVSHHPCPVEHAVFEGVSRYFDPARCELVWRRVAGFHPELAEQPELLSQSLRLDRAQLRFLEMLDGTRTIRRTIDAAPIDVVRAAQLLTALVLVDAVELHEEALEPPSRRPPALHLPVPSLRPSRFPQRRQPSLPPVQPRRRFPSKRSPKLRQTRLQAEHHFQCGKKLLRDRAWAEALEQFQAALGLHPCSEYRLHAEWAKLRATTHPGEVLLARKELRKRAVQVLREDRTLAFAHYVLAELALLDRDHPSARRALALAERFEPHSPEVVGLAARLKL